MIPPRRPKTMRSQTWNLESLEERALLSTVVYGPTSYEPPTVTAANVRNVWFGRFTDAAAPTGPGPAPFINLTRSASAVDRPFGFFTSSSMPMSEPVSFTISTDGRDVIPAFGGSAAADRIDRVDYGAPPPPILVLGIKGAPGIIPPSRALFVSSFARLRDLIDLEAPWFKTDLGPRPFYLPISPGWDSAGFDDDPASIFARSETGSTLINESGGSGNAEEDGGGRDRSQSQTTTYLVASPAVSTASLTIWVDAEPWTDLASLAIELSEYDLGALLPRNESSELTVLLDSLLAELLGESAELSLAVASPLQQVTTLESLDASSLALTATLITVSSDAPAPQTSGPGAPAPHEPPADASLSNSPSWAGFVIGLDEAFEENRRAARRWPAPRPAVPPANAGPAQPDGAELAPSHAAVDDATELLDREESSTSPLLDELILRALEENAADADASLEPSWQDVAGAASLHLALIPALWAERLLPQRRTPTPAVRVRRRTPPRV